ncbi:MAG: PSD1 and planctomycete cytochrome C domain-containing protein [Verrucomicrobiota bacterium]
MNLPRTTPFLPWLGAAICSTSLAFASEGKVDFAREIRPILSNYCFHCHGPDEKNRKGSDKQGLRLDTEEGARRDLGGSFAVVPHHPEKSAILERIESKDKEEVMPPTKSGKKLAPNELALLKRWIQQGAPYAPHWAYQKPNRIEPPASQDPVWGQHIVDRFLLPRILQEGLHPTPPADRATLARRVMLDLTGLPPTPAEVHSFEKDNTPDAYLRFVDRVLAKPTFGEHWARMWLDLARYADSAGYPSDPGRNIWAYRDYVIRAFNSNKRFDQFTIEQLAGDLLPNPTEEQLFATAFHRNTMTNNEGGTVDEEFRNAAVVDRVNTTWSVWMGSSMACAQCHTHKFDPLTQKEYFQFFAAWNQSEDADRNDEAPLREFFLPEEASRRTALQEKIRNLEEKFKKPVPEWTSGFSKWESAYPRDLKWGGAKGAAATSLKGNPIEQRPNGSFFVSGAGAKGGDSYMVELPLPEKQLSAIKLTSIPDEKLPGKGAGAGGNGSFVVDQLRLNYLEDGAKGANARYVRVELLGAARPLQVAELEAFVGGKNVAVGMSATSSGVFGGGLAAKAVDGKSEGAEFVAATLGEKEGDFLEVDLGAMQRVERLRLVVPKTGGYYLGDVKITLLDGAKRVIWSKQETDYREPILEFTPVGGRELKFRAVYATASAPGYEPSTVVGFKAMEPEKNKNRGWSVGPNVRPQSLTLVLDKPQAIKAGDKLHVELEQKAGKREQHLASFLLETTADERVEQVESVPQNIQLLFAKASSDWSAQEQALVKDFYVRNIAPESASDRTELRTAKKELDALTPNTVPIMKELPADKARVTKVQIRGNYLNLGDEVKPGIPAVFSAQPKEGPVDRLVVARWLVSPENPLTARVTVNRFWEALFGVGIVRTSEEFGAQGEMPVHPDLLDWLATEFVRTGWDVKALLKLLVTSAAYQQGSTVSPEALEKDPDNRFVSRGPRFRTTGEVIRDQALFVSGLLSPKMFGKPVRPLKPNMGLSTAFGKGNDWVTSTGEDRYRRSVYTEVRRNSPYPSFITFDAPNREVCTVRRNRTNTPLQAFVTLNDPVFVEAAQAFARKIVREGGPTTEERLRFAYTWVLSRQPTANEITRLTQLLESTRTALQTDPNRAKALATDPLGPAPEGADLVELASWTTLGNVLLNLDEVLMRR